MSRLEDSGAIFSKQILSKNHYSNNKPYNSSNPDALSTGDELGKGEVNGEAGGLTDIKTRNAELAKNKFSNNKPYNSSTA
jgi:hypothetical protein